MKNITNITAKNVLYIGGNTLLDKVIISTIEEQGGDLIVLNPSDYTTVEHQVKEVATKANGFDGIVYGIVHSDFRPLQFVKPDIVDRLMHDNYSLFVEILRVLMKTRSIKRGASIIAMSSISSIRAMKAKMVFCSAKAALDAAVRCLAVELGNKGIRINSIQKGGVDADNEKWHIQDITAINERATEKKQILGLTKAEEIANLVVFLLSDATTTITGTSIVIDGGYTI